ncbi:hypothetical protein HPP92_011317 [Vanilla planifolia]|uniref:Peptidase C14 caspase domain-containing protein n=1 Tax=Vanilla planifolia TaxID=51239 RepID=A0A835UYC0_VANPL|nr:hypothetical protein HPP92_011317 [Vanilla planifolia]
MATLVGCNYPHTKNELRGCINDVLAMKDLLVGRFRFDPADIVVLTDEPGSALLPTGSNIRAELGRMVDRAAPGDVLFFHYSGHGTLIPASKPHRGRRRRRREEAIVPCDFNLITDVDFRELVDRLPGGALFTMVSDSCHSGGLIDKEKQQIGPCSTFPVSSSARWRPKLIPFDSVLQHLTSLSGISSPHVGDHLCTVFGADISRMFVSGEKIRRIPEAAADDDAVLLSGCQADETSADISPEEAEGKKAYGAFSHALQVAVGEAEKSTVMSNRKLVVRARDLLREQGFEQHPCLYCSDGNADAAFLWV